MKTFYLTTEEDKAVAWYSKQIRERTEHISENAEEAIVLKNLIRDQFKLERSIKNRLGLDFKTHTILTKGVCYVEE